MRAIHPIAIAAVFSSVACSPPTAPPPEDSTEQNKATVMRFVEAVNAGDRATIEELMRPDFVRHSQATPDVQITSREQFLAFNDLNAESLPDQQGTMDRLVAEGEFVAFLGTNSGTQRGSMGPFPASERRATADMAGMFRLDGGQIAEMWVTWDNVAFLTQLGHFPRPPGGRP